MDKDGNIQVAPMLFENLLEAPLARFPDWFFEPGRNNFLCCRHSARTCLNQGPFLVMKLWRFCNVSVPTIKSHCAWRDALDDTQEHSLLHCPAFAHERTIWWSNQSLSWQMEAVLLHFRLFSNTTVQNIFICYTLVYLEIKSVMQCMSMFGRLSIQCTCTLTKVVIIRNIEWQGLHHIPSSWTVVTLIGTAVKLQINICVQDFCQILLLSSLPDVVMTGISVGLNFRQLFEHVKPYPWFILHTDSAFALQVWQQVQLAKNVYELQDHKHFAMLKRLWQEKKPTSDYPENESTSQPSWH